MSPILASHHKGKVGVKNGAKILALPRMGRGGSDPAKIFCGFDSLKIRENTGISRKGGGLTMPRFFLWI